MKNAILALVLALSLVALGCAPSAAPSLDDPGGAPTDAAAARSTRAPPAASSVDDADVPPPDDAGPPTGDPSDDDAGDDAGAEPPPGPPFDAGPGGVCTGPPGPGDLVIDELMIASLAGTGDHAEWLEVRSTLACAVNLRGLHGDCPVGAKVHTFDVSDDVWLPAGGTFVVADSLDPAMNHDLPGLVVAWLGNPGDVLRNKGGTVTLTIRGALVDSVTWPVLALQNGVSFAFPAACAAASRADWSTWRLSTASWFPGFLGTPNAPNTDVACP